MVYFFFFSSRRRHTRCSRDWSSDVCSSDLVSKRTKLQVTVEGPTIGRLTTPVETALYRIVQEALNNATRHAQASRARIRLEQNGHLIRCLISDDGIGFDVQAALNKKGDKGLGLIGIRERLNAI